MLVLTRRIGESIVIGNDIRVTVVNVGPGRVKVGVEAPSHVRVDRQEVHARIVEENKSSEQSDHATPEVEPHTIDAEDSPRLVNRIADKLPPDPPAPSRNGKLDPYRRKPR